MCTCRLNDFFFLMAVASLTVHCVQMDGSLAVSNLIPWKC